MKQKGLIRIKNKNGRIKSQIKKEVKIKNANSDEDNSMNTYMYLTKLAVNVVAILLLKIKSL